MIWQLSEQDQDAEMKGAFRKVGKQFRLFYEAMLEEGLPDAVAQNLTCSYGGVVCDLLYMDGSDGERVDEDPYAGEYDAERDE